MKQWPIIGHCGTGRSVIPDTGRKQVYGATRCPGNKATLHDTVLPATEGRRA